MIEHTPARTRIEKAAADAGFDLTPVEEGTWLVFASTAFTPTLGMAVDAARSTQYLLGLSDLAIGRVLSAEFKLSPMDAVGRWATQYEGVKDYELLHQLVLRAASLARALSQKGLREFQAASLAMPSTTEIVREVVQRVGQDIFRRTLIDYWDGKCAVTGLDVVELLRASHIKPWAVCESDEERLDVFNGLLLAPNLDAIFDKGLVTFTDAGELLRGPRLSAKQWSMLGLTDFPQTAIPLTVEHRAYLAWHRARVFQGD